MALTPQQRSWCVLEFGKVKSVVTVQRAFRRTFHMNPPTNKSILKWYNDFVEKGCICNQRKGHSGRPSVSVEVVNRVRETFLRSPKKSTRRASRELQIPTSTVKKNLRTRLRFRPYKLQLVQKLQPQDKVTRSEFCTNLQALMENDDNLLSSIIFSDEATFNLHGRVNRHNVRIWGSENPRATLEIERDSPKLNVFCAISERTVYGPFFFEGQTVNGQRYLQMLMNWLFPQLAAEGGHYLFQQDGAPPHWHLAVRTYLNEHLPNRWIGRAGPNDQVLFKWPPRSPDLTVCDFFLWGYVKDIVYRPPLPATLDDLQERITGAINSITVDILHRVWSELDYRIDVCRATGGAHIECL